MLFLLDKMIEWLVEMFVMPASLLKSYNGDVGWKYHIHGDVKFVNYFIIYPILYWYRLFILLYYIYNIIILL